MRPLFRSNAGFEPLAGRLGVFGLVSAALTTAALFLSFPLGFAYFHLPPSIYAFPFFFARLGPTIMAFTGFGYGITIGFVLSGGYVTKVLQNHLSETKKQFEERTQKAAQ